MCAQTVCGVCREPIRGKSHRVPMGLRTERTRVVCEYCFEHWVPKRRCDVCEREYASFTRAWEHNFCSLRCEKLYYGRGEEKFVLPRRICVGCGEEFQPTRIDQYHHSNGGVCRMRARRKRLGSSARG